jgi:hypothetical protein
MVTDDPRTVPDNVHPITRKMQVVDERDMWKQKSLA